MFEHSEIISSSRTVLFRIISSFRESYSDEARNDKTLKQGQFMLDGIRRNCFKCSSNSIMMFRSNSIFKIMCSAFSARSEKLIRQFPSNKGFDSIDK